MNMIGEKYDFQKLQIRLNSLEKNSVKRNVIKHNDIKFNFLNFNNIENDDIVLIKKIDNSFRFDVKNHIVDFTKLEALSNELQNNKFKKLLSELSDELKNVNEFRTKKGDKLYFICPFNNEEFCPVCSFIGAMKNLLFMPILNSPNLNLENDELPDNYEFLKTISLINVLIDSIISSVYLMENYYLIGILINPTKDTTINLINIDKKDLQIVNDSLLKYLSDNNLDIGEINSFSLIKKENMFNLYDYNEYILRKNYSGLYQNMAMKMDGLNKSYIQSLLFGRRIDTIPSIQNVFERIFNSFSEELINIINSEVIV
jgi:hypothetical protein